MRDNFQFTAELRKVLHSLPPRAARAACETLRNPPAAWSSSASLSADGSAARGKKKRERWSDAPPCTGQGVGVAAAAASGVEADDDELTYMTQVRAGWSLACALVLGPCKVRAKFVRRPGCVCVSTAVHRFALSLPYTAGACGLELVALPRYWMVLPVVARPVCVNV